MNNADKRLDSSSKLTLFAVLQWTIAPAAIVVIGCCVQTAGPYHSWYHRELDEGIRVRIVKCCAPVLNLVQHCHHRYPLSTTINLTISGSKDLARGIIAHLDPTTKQPGTNSSQAHDTAQKYV